MRKLPNLQMRNAPTPHWRVFLQEFQKIHFWEKVILAVIFGILMQFNLFGMTAVTDFQAERVFSRLIFSNLYPNAEKDRISVLIIDQDFINDKAERHWPLNYREYADLLEDITKNGRYTPKAIFLDLMFLKMHDNKTDLDYFVQRLKKIQNQEKIPIYIADSHKWHDDECSPELPRDVHELIGDKATAQENPVRAIYEAVGQSHVVYPLSSCNNRYPLMLSKNPDVLTPAFAMYCQNELGKDECQQKLQIAEVFEKPMFTIWGARLTKEIKTFWQNATGMSCNSVDFAENLTKMFTFNNSVTPWQNNTCYFHNTVYLSNLRHGLKNKDEGVNIQKQYFDDHYVFIGQNVAGQNDFFESDIYGLVPGVFVHAMALDNLITYQDKYYRDMNVIFKTIVTILSLFIVMGVMERINQLLIEKNKPFFHRCLIIKIVIPFVFFFLIIPIFWIIFHFAPADWAGIVILSFIENPISLKDIVIHVTRKIIH